MMWEYAGPIFTIASFVLTAIGMLVAVTRSLSNMEMGLRKAINDSRDEIEEKQQVMAREFGETVKALKEHVHHIETWARDEFVRKGSFEQALGRMERTLESRFADIVKSVDRLTEKIDSKT